MIRRVRSTVPKVTITTVLVYVPYHTTRKWARGRSSLLRSKPRMLKKCTTTVSAKMLIFIATTCLECLPPLFSPSSLLFALAAEDSGTKPQRKTGRKSIVKLSRKQKLRKQAKAARAEKLADQAEVKAHRDQRKMAFRLKAKSLW